MVAGTNVDWMEKGRCYGTGFDFFTNEYWEIKACVMMCYRCPVRIQCLEYAIDQGIEHGIWGGVKGHTLALLRDYKRRGRRIKQLQKDYVNNWAIGGGWEQMAGWDYDEGRGRPRGDGYSCLEKN